MLVTGHEKGESTMSLDYEVPDMGSCKQAYIIARTISSTCFIIAQKDDGRG